MSDYTDYDLEFAQESPRGSARRIGRYRHDREVLAGALMLVANGEVERPEELAKNVLDRVFGSPDGKRDI